MRGGVSFVWWATSKWKMELGVGKYREIIKTYKNGIDAIRKIVLVPLSNPLQKTWFFSTDSLDLLFYTQENSLQIFWMY